ncbi:hypothetical protein FGO68_gene3293 [Halteria grandinella]|uniref:Translation initiation factor eIF2B subunit beta n=1 Tax=Halteria grandinella TaxID=5974 RepID=A0A8J8NQF6_HALGN|nr:hypothetical protein FGO68_gene3293 [Halteria grandinella]
MQKLKNNVLSAINNLREDIENVPEIIASQAKEHIHANDVILTYGRSSNVLIGFFQEAAKEMFFEVVVCESAPSYSGQLTAKTLADKCGISTTLIPDAAVFALMSRVDKVIIGTHAIMANGGLVTHTGAYMLALAAQAHSVPVYVIGPMYKMTPLYPFDFLTFNELLSPKEIFTLGEHDKAENIEVVVPAYDYVPPELVSLYITPQGGQTPKYIYRVFTEFYSQDDIYDLDDNSEEGSGAVGEAPQADEQ